MSKDKLSTMRQCGKILGEVLEEVMKSIEPGMTEIEIDTLAESLIAKKGGEPGFKRVPGYTNTVCMSVNNVVVHGIPTNRKIQKGDIVGVDCGVYLDGYHTDMAETILLEGEKAEENEFKRHFLKTGKEALFSAIRQAKAGNRVGHLSQKMQQGIESGGFSVVKSLVGHGVGEELHMEPEIPGYLSKQIDKTPVLKKDMTIAVEIIYNEGRDEVVYDRGDDWTIVTGDNGLSGLFERSLIVGDTGPELLTRFSDDRL